MNFKKSKSFLNNFFYLLSADQRLSLIYLFIFLIIGTLMEMIGIAILMPLLSLFSGAKNNDFINKIFAIFKFRTENSIFYFVSAILVFNFFKFLYLIFLSWKQSSFITKLSYNLSSSLFKGYLNQPYTFHIQNNSSVLLRNLQSELSQFATYTQAFVMLFLELMTIIGIGGILIYNQPMVSLISATFLFIIVYFFNKYTKSKILNWGIIRQEQSENINKHFFHGLGGIKEVKFFGKESFFYKEVETILRSNSIISTKYLTIGQIPRYFLEFISILGIFIIILFMQFYDIDAKLILPILGLYLAASFRLIPSVNRILNSIQTMKYLNPAIDLLYNEFQLINQISENKNTNQNFFFNDKIELNNICFHYPNTKSLVLNNLSISIQKGSTIGIIGQSGSGKSTLIDILLGLHKQLSGQILVDGINIKDNIRNWQKNIGYVPQNVYLLDDTIKSNVAFGIDPELIDEESVDLALRSAQLAEFIEKIPGGKNSIVGERGVKLSGGQKQRIGIARALYNNPEILVLDEATSSLDNKNEENFMDTIMLFKNSKTIIIIAHRLSTLNFCDIIYEISNGKIINNYDPKDLNTRIN
jgi:ABC-type multidrug transport system fused ATPase/permease subunit